MHIGVFSYYYLPVINGVVITIEDWKRYAEAAGHKFTICIPRLESTPPTDPDVFVYPSVPLYKKLGITVPMFPEAFIEKEFRKQKIDLVHAHHPFYIGRLALMTKKRLGIPLVFTYHTRYADYFASYLPWISGEFVKRMVTRVMVRFLNQCDAVTVANNTLKEELLTHGVRAPIFIVPPGIDTKKFSSGNRDDTRKRLGIRPQEHVYLYVGRLAKEKNIYFLLRAFTRMAKQRGDIRLILCGNGMEEDRLKKFVRSKHLEEHVLLATHENLQTIADIYAAADIFVYASQTETYGRVIVEAMAAGLAVVALRGPSVGDILHDGITGRIVFSLSPKAFARIALETIPDARSLGRQAQREAVTHYDSQVSWESLSHVYQSVLRNSS